MKTNLLAICLLLFSSQVFASNNMSGTNLFCEEHNLFVTYNFLDNKRYKTTNYFLVYFDIGIREGTYGYLNNHRYLYLKADKKIEIYNNLNKTDNEKNWQKKVAEVPKLDYYLDTQDLNITFSPGKNSQIKSTCKLFDGTAKELRDSSLKKYLKYFDNDN